MWLLLLRFWPLLVLLLEGLVVSAARRGIGEFAAVKLWRSLKITMLKHGERRLLLLAVAAVALVSLLWQVEGKGSLWRRKHG